MSRSNLHNKYMRKPWKGRSFFTAKAKVREEVRREIGNQTQSQEN